MLELDEDDLESLGWGGQRAYEVLAADLEYASAAYNKYMREYMRQWRINNAAKAKKIAKASRANIKADPTKYSKKKASDKKYRKSTKGVAMLKRKSKKYRNKYKETLKLKRKQKTERINGIK